MPATSHVHARGSGTSDGTFRQSVKAVEPSSVWVPVCPRFGSPQMLFCRAVDRTTAPGRRPADGAHRPHWPRSGVACRLHRAVLCLSRLAIPLIIAGGEDAGDFTGRRLDGVLTAHARDLDGQPYRSVVATEPDDPVG